MNVLIRSAGMLTLLTASTALNAETLHEIYQLAVKNDASLKAAEATYRADIETEVQARSALLPQINGSASYSEEDSAERSLYSNYDRDSDTETEAYTISLQQKLFDLPSWFSFKAGQELSRQAKAQLSYDQQNLIVRVSEAYFNVLRQLDNLEASRAEERATKRQLEQTQQRFDVGLIAITDVHEARARYDNTVVQRLSDEGNVGTAYEALAVLTGQHHANLWKLKESYPVIDTVPAERASWVDFALQNNFQLQAAMAGSEAARQNSKSKRFEHLPKLSGSYSYTDRDSDGDSDSNIVTGPSSPFDSASEGDTWSINLTVPVFSGGRISSQRRQAAEQYNAALQRKINAERSVIQATRSLHLQVTTDVQRVKARSQAIVSTQSALDATQAGYEVGTRNIVDVLDAQQNLYGAIRDYANARYDYVLNSLKLKQQAGTLSPADVLDLEKWLNAPEPPKASEQIK